MKFDTVPTGGSRTDTCEWTDVQTGMDRRDEANRIDVMKLIG